MKLAKLFPHLFIMLLLLSCSHTNKLSKYELNNKNIHFKQIVEPNAKGVKFSFNENPISGGNVQAQVDASADAGSAVISKSIEERFEKGIETDKLLDNIVYTLQSSLNEIYNIKLEATVNDLTDYIFETKLTKCLLQASDFGITVTLESDAAIYDKKSNQIIWDYTGSSTIPIQKNRNMMLDQQHNLATSVVNTAELDRITNEQIQKSVSSATENVKQNIIEALQEDLSKAGE